jgi:NAD(P)H-quinone oxidoreductase subunit 5
MFFNILANTLWLVPCYALFGSLLSLFWSPGLIKTTGPRPAGYLSLFLTSLGFLHGLLAFTYLTSHPARDISWQWLHTEDLLITLDLRFSLLSAGALLVITGLNLLAEIYAIGYLEMDWGWARFYSLMGLFQAGLTCLVLCESLFFSYVLLEILTLGTYLLIGFWFNQSLVVTGARDAFLTKRVGDLFLLMGVVALLPLANTWNYDQLTLWSKSITLNPNIASLICLALIAGPLGKCAQFPLHLWLDEAMEGPLPATILRNTVVVSSGAWVLVKLEPVFAISPLAQIVMVTIGSATAIGASCIAIAQIDIKRSLSYTVSAYMGLIFIAVGTHHTQAALTLLLTYAVAMALLVMVIGGIIWNSITQDLTQYGGLWSRRPISGICYLIGVASLVALPPFGSFWSLSELVRDQPPLIVLLILLVNGLTAFSLVREFALVFGGPVKPFTVRSSEVLWPMVLPMTILGGIALHLPLILKSLGLLPEVQLDLLVMLTLSTLLGGSLAGYIYLNQTIVKPVTLLPKSIRDFFANDLYTSQIYRLTIVGIVAKLSDILAWLDRFLVDGIVNFVGMAILVGGEGLKYNNSGRSQSYILSIMLGLVVFGLLIAWPLLAQVSLTPVH